MISRRSSAAFRDKPEFKRGRSGEKIVARLLQRRGWFVVPSYDYSGEDGDKAPIMQGTTQSFVIPDLDVAQAGRRIWVEVKTKACANLHRKTKTYEHGIDLRHYQHYCRVQEETATPVWLFVFEEQSGYVLAASLTQLGAPRVYAGDKMGRDGMAFFARNKFKVVELVVEAPSSNADAADSQRRPVQTAAELALFQSGRP
jgi:hypothetical protein